MLINVHVKYKMYVPITIFIEVCASKSELRDRCERADLFGLLLHVTGIRVTSLLPNTIYNTLILSCVFTLFHVFCCLSCVLLCLLCFVCFAVFLCIMCFAVHQVFLCVTCNLLVFRCASCIYKSLYCTYILALF